METSNERDPEEGFFCSELVAEAYKCAGLLDESISSVRYLPGEFNISLIIINYCSFVFSKKKT